MKIAENHRNGKKSSVFNGPKFSNLLNQYFLRYWLKTKKNQKKPKFCPQKATFSTTKSQIASEMMLINFYIVQYINNTMITVTFMKFENQI